MAWDRLNMGALPGAIAASRSALTPLFVVAGTVELDTNFTFGDNSLEDSQDSQPSAKPSMRATRQPSACSAAQRQCSPNAVPVQCECSTSSTPQPVHCSACQFQ